MEKHVALIVLFDNKKKILLQHRTSDAPAYPNKWGFFGGEIEEGETPEESVKRECFEELEYELESPKLILKISLDLKNRRLVKYAFLERYNPNKKLVLHEGQGMRWVTCEEFEKLDLVEHDLPIYKKIFEKIK